jgi:hypothetical protein
MLKAAMILLAAGLLALAATAAAAEPPAKHRVHAKAPRHTARHAYGRPYYVGPGPGIPGYNYGGPMYSTCDRINADRMLAGTCR